MDDERREPTILDAEVAGPSAIEPSVGVPREIVRTQEDVDRVEKQIQLTAEAHRRFRIAALRVTKSDDWIDESGKPWLQAKGVERLAALFRIRERNVKAEKLDHEGGAYTILVSGELASDLLDPEGWVSSVGSRYSHEGFFTGGDKKKEPVYGDVLKAAYSNWKARAVTALLGIRGLPWAELEVAGIKREDAGAKVSHAGAASMGKMVPMKLRNISDKDKFKGAVKEKAGSYPRWDADKKQWLVPEEAVNVATQWADTAEENRGPRNGGSAVQAGGGRAAEGGSE